MQFFRLSLFAIAVAVVAAIQSAAQAPAPQQPQPVAPQVWRMQVSATTAGLRGIDSVDGTVAWASGTEGTVLKTTDGGAHWTKCAVPDGDKDGATLDFRGVQAWDATTAIVMASGPGEKSRLYKTIDGCKSWAILFKNPDSPNGFFDSFCLRPNADRFDGIVLGDPVKGGFVILETADGGRSWHRDSRSGLRTSGRNLAAFAASNSLIAQFPNGFLRGFVTGGKGGSFLVYRWNEKNWLQSAIPVASGMESSGAFSLGLRFTLPHCTDCERPSDHYFIAVGGDYAKPNESSGTAAWSNDLGKTWTASTTPPHGYRSTVQWSQSESLWIAAGTNGSDISRDDGRTWQPLDNGTWNALSLPFIVGPKGRIARLNPSAIPKP